MKRVVVAGLAALSLSGCLEPTPPDPAVQAMAAQCQAGNQMACANYAQIQQVEAARYNTLMTQLQSNQPAPMPYMMPTQPQVTCYPGFAGEFTCR